MRFCLIGYPLVHSMSPFIQRRLFELSGVKGSYRCIEIPPQELTETHPVFYDYDGFNVTIPHKLAVLPFLSEIAGEAKLLGAVNTVKREKDRLIGYNTDCEGFQQSLHNAGIALKGRVLIAGYGGTARMMAFLAARQNCSVTLAVRHPNADRALELKQELLAAFPRLELEMLAPHEIDGTFDLLLNGTPAGMYPKNTGLLPVEERLVRSSAAVFDAVYNPRDTALLKLARACGAKTAGGMSMLTLQAAAAHRIWYGASFSAEQTGLVCEEANRELERMFPL